MPKRTQLLSVVPWTGGLNTSLEEGLIGPNQLTIANNLLFREQQSKLKRDGINFNFDTATAGSNNIIGLNDFYFISASTKVHRLFSIDETGAFFSYVEGGTRTTRTPAATAEVTSITCPAKATIGASQFFLINSANNTTEYYVWYDTTGADTDPVNQSPPAIFGLSGKTGIKVVITTDVTATDVAVRTTTAINATGGADFTATSTGAVVTNTNDATGPAKDATNINVTSLTISITTQGSGAKWTTPTIVSMKTINNILIMAANGTGNNLFYWDGATTLALDLTTNPNYDPTDPNPPSCSLLQTHLGRLWTNDKSNFDRLHFSETFNPFKWQGAGDSGAIDVGTGDGDPEGIIAIFPTFKGELFVAKRTKLYRISGFTPETFQVILVSDGIGAISQNAVVPVEQDDIYWISERGIHSLNATASFGDVESKFVSADIQKTFNDDFTKTRLKNSWGAYLNTINSIAFAITLSTKTFNNDLFLYNIPLRAWYKWPDIDCESLITATDAAQKRFYLGGSNGRVFKTFTGDNFDTNNAGSQVSVPFKVKTGRIFPDNSPYTFKGYKKFSLVFRPIGSQTISSMIKIDSQLEQSLAFGQTGSVDLLGTTFILGSSILGAEFIMEPYTQSIEGFGRGIQITLEQNDANESVEIQGFMVEYEQAGDSQEVLV